MPKNLLVSPFEFGGNWEIFYMIMEILETHSSVFGSAMFCF